MAMISKGAQLDDTVPLPENPDRLVLRAVEVFGCVDKAQSWLRSPNPAFEGKSPSEAARTSDGRQAVLDVLFDLDHGFPA